MPNSPMGRARIAALQLAAAFVFALHAQAAEPPDNVADAVTEAAQTCKDDGGTPNTDAVLSVEDVNGDGGEDWIVDYAKLKCEGAVDPLCDSDGCTLQIFLWDGATAWNLAYEETVRSYKLTKNGGKRVLKVKLAGSACDRPNTQSCTHIYRLEPTAIVPAE
jgi:hypothetical protein